MPTYKFNAIDNTGKKVKDTIDASTLAEATETIRGQGFFPTNIKEVKESKRKAKERESVISGKTRRKQSITIGGVSSKQLFSFTRQLSTLINANVPIIRSLNILESQLKPCLLKKSLGAIIDDIEDGSSLSDAMSKHKRAFSKIYVNTIKAGEIGGMLDAILVRLADFLEKMDRLKKKIISALTYPVSVIFIAGAIITGIMMFIIPGFVEMFEDMEIKGGLPVMTLMVMAASNFMVKYWYVLIGVPFGLFILKKLLSKIRKFRYIMDKMAFKIPIFGKIINKAVISGFCRTLATLTSAGVPILEAFINTKDATKNEVLVVAIDRIYDSVREGGTIGEPLRQSKITDEIVVNMVEVGEETGELDSMLVKVADNLDAEVDAMVEAMTSLIEPMLIVFLGGAIGFIVIAMFMPMIKMMESLG
ncbi:MAG: type II secretion system F family protein [Candidatus Anammoxibacter sp.]